MTDDCRIQQFEQMVLADPENELGHFSLGRAYQDGQRFEDAVRCFNRVLEINPKMSKAYQLLGEALDQAARRDEAVEALTRGIRVAHELGDRMPLTEMADKLRSWDAPVPEEAQVSAPSAGAATTIQGDSSSGFQCCRCGRPSGQLEKPPFRGVLGEKIFNHTCSGCWREWIPMGTKVINELGLSLSSQAGQESYDQYMVEFLQLEDV